jgi:hypothetical protein
MSPSEDDHVCTAAGEQPPAKIWGLPALDDDTFASVVAALLETGETSDVAAMARTCRDLARALEDGLRERKERRLVALTRRLGWSVEMMADAQILHSTGTGISDSDLLLLCFLLFNETPPAPLTSPMASLGLVPDTRVAPLLDHLNLGSNCITDRGVLGLIDAASRAPRSRLECLMLSGNQIGDGGALALAHAIEAGVAFPGLKMLSVGANANMSSVGEAALRTVCHACGVSVRGVGALRGAPLVKRPMQGSWVVQVAVDPDEARTRSSASEHAFARDVRERAAARGDPLISFAPPHLDQQMAEMTLT